MACTSNSQFYPVAVRALCSFTSKRGDLDRRFTPAPSAQQGIAGHAIVASRRPGDYQKEIWLSGEYGPLQIRGRADGYDPDGHRLEEYKTYRGDLTRMPENHRALHWAQLKAYALLLCRRDHLSRINLALVYFDIDTQTETVLSERFELAALQDFFNDICRRFADWATRELAHSRARDQALRAMAFPYPDFHSGQRQLAEAVYRAANGSHCLLAQAPTGIGKTLGTLFPVLKAMAMGKLDRIFYLAAKTTGRQPALQALRALKNRDPAMPLRVLDLVAREKACVHPDKACHGESCPLAKRFYDNLPRARDDALTCQMMDQPSLAKVAAEHGVCPYYLSQEMVRWSDVVVADYNQYLDYGGMLHALVLENQWRTAVLVDEAHNLVERARAMNSIDLSRPGLDAAVRCAPASIKPALARLVRQWSVYDSTDVDSYMVYERPPELLLAALRDALSRIGEYAAERFDDMDIDLTDFYFATMRFCQLAETLAEHSLLDVSVTVREGRECSTWSIRNVIPAFHLRARFAAATCVILFSGTLSPSKYYLDMFGLPADSRYIDVPSPFSVEQLAVHVVEEISTRFRDRASSVAPICRLMARQFDAEPGNYLVFVSSFDYLEQLFESFTACYPVIDAWKQRRSMNDSERLIYLERFVAGGEGIGFAVLGGAFAEGIDLPGRRLIGAFIATLGMPQVNPVNQEMLRRMQSVFGSGHDYVYLYPGLQKVAHAAGRVIRSISDRGTLYLIDDRYARENVRRHLPSWWQMHRR